MLVQRIRAFCSLYSEVRKKKPNPLEYCTSKIIYVLKLRCMREDLAKYISSFIVLRQPNRVYWPSRCVIGEYLYLLTARSLLPFQCHAVVRQAHRGWGLSSACQPGSPVVVKVRARTLFVGGQAVMALSKLVCQRRA